MDTTISTWTRRLWIARRIVSKKLFRVLGPVNRLLGPKESYGIKPGYHHAGSALAFDDKSNKDEWQKSVYQLAASIMKEKNYTSVLDVGCGSAYKLLNYLGEYKTTGIEVQSTYQWLKQNYPGHTWLQFDVDAPETLQSDLVICSDVIEHLKDPDELIRYIGSIRSNLIIFSTPERNRIAGKPDYGPPENPYHYREWSSEEFRKYISKVFVIQEQRIFNDQSITQVIICKK